MIILAIGGSGIGDMKIELTVKGDAGKEKTATANVTLKKTESGTDPEPEPDPEPEQEVTCEITTLTSGETFDLATVTELNITGKATVNVGTSETFYSKKQAGGNCSCSCSG